MLKKYEEEDGRYLICGTNAYKPECRDYVEVIFPQAMIFSRHLLSRDLVQDGDTYLMTKKSKGVGLCPYRFPLTTESLLESKAAKRQLHQKRQNMTLILTRLARTTTAQQFSSGINCTRAPPQIIRFVFNNNFGDQVVLWVHLGQCF